MKSITATIEHAPDGGIAIYTDDLTAVWGYGLTEEEAKTDFLETLKMQSEEQGFEMPSEIVYQRD